MYKSLKNFLRLLDFCYSCCFWNYELSNYLKKFSLFCFNYNIINKKIGGKPTTKVFFISNIVDSKFVATTDRASISSIEWSCFLVALALSYHTTLFLWPGVLFVNVKSVLAVLPQTGILLVCWLLLKQGIVSLDHYPKTQSIALFQFVK